LNGFSIIVENTELGRCNVDFSFVQGHTKGTMTIL